MEKQSLYTYCPTGTKLIFININIYIPMTLYLKLCQIWTKYSWVKCQRHLLIGLTRQREEWMGGHTKRI